MTLRRGTYFEVTPLQSVEVEAESLSEALELARRWIDTQPSPEQIVFAMNLEYPHRAGPDDPNVVLTLFVKEETS